MSEKKKNKKKGDKHEKEELKHGNLTIENEDEKVRRKNG